LSVLIFSTPSEIPTGSGTISAQITKSAQWHCDKPAVSDGALAGRADNGKSARTMSASVKVCGWRPHDGGAAHAGAGVRKPPREETAGCRAR
jgi:hypothetical protein